MSLFIWPFVIKMSKTFPKKQFSTSCPHTWSVRNWQGILPLDSHWSPKPAFLSNFICPQGFIDHLLLITFSSYLSMLVLFPPFNHAPIRASQIFNLGWSPPFCICLDQNWFYCSAITIFSLSSSVTVDNDLFSITKAQTLR